MNANEINEMTRMMMEDKLHWVEIDGFPGYQICFDRTTDSKARVRSFRRRMGAGIGRGSRVVVDYDSPPQDITIRHRPGCRYYTVELRDENKNQRSQNIHRLLAIAFVPNPNNYPDVDHADRDCLNNELSNLRWVTKSQNNMNRGLDRRNRTGVTGVRMSGNRYEASWYVEGEQQFAYFDTLEEAIQHRLQMEEQHYGGFGPNHTR